MNLFAFRSIATLLARSSEFRLKLSPVTETQIGESTTTLPRSSWKFMPSVSTRLTVPEWQKSMPSITPTGFAVTKLPETTLSLSPCIGVFPRPIESLDVMLYWMSPQTLFIMLKLLVSAMRILL